MSLLYSAKARIGLGDGFGPSGHTALGAVALISRGFSAQLGFLCCAVGDCGWGEAFGDAAKTLAASAAAMSVSSASTMA